LQLTRRVDALPTTRHYMMEAEHAAAPSARQVA